MMLRTLERYLEEKTLVLNTRKTKIMRFKSGGGRRKKWGWKWKGKEIEDVREYKYLGCVIEKHGMQKRQVKDRVRWAAAVTRQVWGIGKRRYKADWERKMWMYDRVVWTVVSYGTEVWGWKEREEVESMQEKYLTRTPEYLLREEVGRRKMRSRAGRRAWKFERKLKEGEGSEWARKWLQEIRARAEGGENISTWEKERKEFLRGRGVETEELEGQGDLGGGNGKRWKAEMRTKGGGRIGTE